MSECFEQIHLAVQSYDDTELCSYVATFARTARYNRQSVEAVIIALKSAINTLPTSVLRERARCELRDAVVRVAIQAYYDGIDSPTPRLASR